MFILHRHSKNRRCQDDQAEKINANKSKHSQLRLPDGAALTWPTSLCRPGKAFTPPPGNK
ncbi:hypothetical protein CKO_03835 [Citrobacter koseri ATCC BAA-895]|uniref:Uncharacterized protein n=1 Tax=Citrobacter koseri (strain ATCC BAA-895 / CDC 4225-83 / SGSC4696) TaxID=290338 RepID=A8AN47_CITK8|nr:hypothetical protein CKO_03835 [Citrobacter koseri ATCC BAA-895]